MDNANSLTKALDHPLYKAHKIGDTYTMDGMPDLWKIVYYPIFEDGKTGKSYNEPRALVEKPIPNGVDFREVPLRYLSRHSRGCSAYQSLRPSMRGGG